MTWTRKPHLSRKLITDEQNSGKSFDSIFLYILQKYSHLICSKIRYVDWYKPASFYPPVGSFMLHLNKFALFIDAGKRKEKESRSKYAIQFVCLKINMPQIMSKCPYMNIGTKFFWLMIIHGIVLAKTSMFYLSREVITAKFSVHRNVILRDLKRKSEGILLWTNLVCSF